MDYLSEVSQDLGQSKPLSSCLRYSLSSPNQEVGCVFYFNESFSDYNFLNIQSKNLIEKNFFSCSDSTFYKLFKENRVISLFHTHIESGPELSDFDIEIANSFILPSCVFSVKTKEFNLYYPENFKPRPLSKRIFIPMFQDCITFVKDFYLKHMQINLHTITNNWARDRKNSNEILINVLNDNFFEVNKKDLKYGDIIVMRPLDSRYFHLVVYLGSNEVFHHPMFMLPRKEFIKPEALNKVYKVYRYKEG